ncbi:hybrid sensor histidine kinase/response regulator [Prosthecochloris vibrioformis]|uniref:histidine kinase n=1 Tax=Prosthecochloris vibrioformis TaxID=1098 RepID=A0A5C4RYX2_PROVB|nr:PAS domain S-box protein [Prosthecochloris vibrioformis]TNJ36129.1 PAS domain S-box protein [Prosthecochloris vibrioformis]
MAITNTARLASCDFNEIYQFMAEQSGDIIWLYDFSVDRYIYASPSVERFRGFTQEEIKQQHLLDALTPEDQEKAKKQIAERLERINSGDTSARFGISEYEQICKDGSTIMTEVMSTFIVDNEGKLAGIVGVARDITERKRFESEHKKLQEQLIKAGKMDSIGRIAGGIAHTFNNKLQTIMSSAELLDNSAADPEQKQFLNVIQTSIHECSKLTNQLLTLAKKQAVMPKVVNGNELIAQQLEQYHTQDCPASITFNPEPHLWPFRIDPAQFDNMLESLLRNSFEALQDGGTITITTKNIPASHDHPQDICAIEVADSGCGIPPHLLKQVCEPFFSTKPGAKGLGLSMVNGIIEQNNGHMTIESRQDNGTICRIFLPRSIEPGSRNRKETGIFPSSNRKATVLLVDDDSAIRHLTRIFLEKSGFNVLEAESGEKALGIAGSYPEYIDVLLTDMIMPGMNGRQLAEATAELLPGIKILYMSGYSSNILTDSEAKATPEVNFLAKPFSRELLATTMLGILG